jgi:hypothetical protein
LKKPGRQKIYQGEVVQVLEQIWEICGRICSKRLQPFLPEIVTILERHHELCLSSPIKSLLLSMSRSTIDRCLKKARFTSPQRGLSTTKPGTLLKQAIPIRTFTPWEEERPGFLEIDLVAHYPTRPLDMDDDVENPKRKPSQLPLKNKRQPQILQQGQHQAIYAYELWEQNMQLRQSKGIAPATKNRPKREYLLTGVGR